MVLGGWAVRITSLLASGGGGGCRGRFSKDEEFWKMNENQSAV